MFRYQAVALLCAIFLTGCETLSEQHPTEEQKDRLRSAQSIKIVVDIKDQIFGTRLSGMFMKPTDDIQTDWNTNKILSERLIAKLSQEGRNIYDVPIDTIETVDTTGNKSVNDALSKVSRAVSASSPEFDADIHFIVSHVPVDPVPRPITGSGMGMVSQGLVGIFWEVSTKYKPSYVVRVNSGLNAKAWGKAQCIVVYSIAVVDANTHQVIHKLHPRWTDNPLPDDFWIEDYQSLSADSKNVLRKSCWDALNTAIDEDLIAMGLLRKAE